VGCAELIETGHEKWKYMIAAPTMRVPESVAHTINAYLAFRAILLSIENFHKAAGKRVIDSLVCCGLGTGVGNMSAAKCAGQMELAYKAMIMAAVIGRFESIHGFHNTLRNL
jgi:O-acetyl-ADP-ribose deacetylase (regulator of RNase III)